MLCRVQLTPNICGNGLGLTKSLMVRRLAAACAIMACWWDLLNNNVNRIHQISTQHGVLPEHGRSAPDT